MFLNQKVPGKILLTSFVQVLHKAIAMYLKQEVPEKTLLGSFVQNLHLAVIAMFHIQEAPGKILLTFVQILDEVTVILKVVRIYHYFGRFLRPFEAFYTVVRQRIK